MPLARPTTHTPGSTHPSQPPVHPTESINELSRQFWNSAILRACIKLDLITLLDAEGPLDPAEIARRIDGDERYTEALLAAAEALGLLQCRPQPSGRAYELSDEARRFLLPNSADYVGNLVLHITNYWQTWGNLDRLVLEGRTELPFHNGYTAEAEYWGDYMAGQHDRAGAGQGHHLAEALDLSKRELLFDLGGGAGSYSIALCEANPELRAIVIDAPEPLAIAEPLVAEAGLEDRVELVAGDLFDPDLYAELPDGADAALISGVVLIKTEAQCRTLFRRAHDMLDEAGLMIVQDFMRLDDSPRRRFLDTMMDLYVLIGFDPGSADRPGEVYEAWLADAGFVDISGIPLPTQLAVITAEKPRTVG